jgi:hypothetical protein
MRNKPTEAKTGWGKIAPWAVLSLGSFLAGLLLVGLYLTNLRLLASLGLEGHFYYLVLLPLSLSVTGMLFGALRATAQFRGKPLGGALKIGGSIVGLLLIVILGFVLPKPASNFPLTVYVHGSAGQQDIPLRNRGEVWLDLGGDRRSEHIGERGEAFFKEVPANFHGQKVNVTLDASGYERSDNGRLELEGTSLYVEVKRKSCRIAGSVVDENGKPVIGATVSVANVSTLSKKLGLFDLVVPSDQVLDLMILRVSAPGYQTWSEMVMPNGAPVSAMLRR